MIKNVSDPGISNVLSTEVSTAYGHRGRAPGRHGRRLPQRLSLNEDLVSVDCWTKEQIETRTEKLVELALRAFTFDDIEF